MRFGSVMPEASVSGVNNLLMSVPKIFEADLQVYIYHCQFISIDLTVIFECVYTVRILNCGLSGFRPVSVMISIIGIPLDYNSSHERGPAEAPDKIRAALTSGSMNMCAENLFDLADESQIEDLGNIEIGSPQDGFSSIEGFTGAVLAKGHSPLTLGGDHSITYPVLKAVNAHYEPPTIVHFDAHPDLYDNFDDNPHSHASPFARIMENGLASRLVQIGLRTINTHQQEQIFRFGVDVIEARHFSLEAFKSLGVKGPVYISVDLDGLDPAYAPGVSHFEPGGLSTRDVLSVIQAIEGPVIGADIVEYNPRKDLNDMTAYVAAKILKELAAAIGA